MDGAVLETALDLVLPPGTLATSKPQLIHIESHAPNTERERCHTLVFTYSLNKCTEIYLDKAYIKLRPYTIQHTKTHC